MGIHAAGMHNNAMAIGLALAANRPRSNPYHVVDEALVRQVWEVLRSLWCALATLPTRAQALLPGGAGDFFQLDAMIAHLEATFYPQGASEN